MRSAVTVRAQCTSLLLRWVTKGYSDRELVKTFHTKGLEAGGKCNGPPGLRPEYTRMYYAAFVHDPVGNNVEVMCMWPAWTHWKYWFGLGVFGEKDKSL